MKRNLLALILAALAALGVAAAPVAAAGPVDRQIVTEAATTVATTPTVTIESQAWWLKTGVFIPNDVGKHVHVKATFPADGYPIDGLFTIDGTVTLHNQVGPADKTNWIRIGSWGPHDEQFVLAQQMLFMGPCGDCTQSFSLTIDLSKLPTGRNELRISANLPRNTEGNRQYQSFGEQVCVRSCIPSYRPDPSNPKPYNEARGWYTGHGYANAALYTALSGVCSACTINVRLDHGSGGLATKFSGVYIDPDFHHGYAGIWSKIWTGAFRGNVTLPLVASGPHKLVLLSSDGQNAGVLAYTFQVP